MTRPFIPISQQDISSASRALKIATASDAELERLAASHKTLDIYASKVIVEAVEREKDRRWERGAG